MASVENAHFCPQKFMKMLQNPKSGLGTQVEHQVPSDHQIKCESYIQFQRNCIELKVFLRCIIFLLELCAINIFKIYYLSLSLYSSENYNIMGKSKNQCHFICCIAFYMKEEEKIQLSKHILYRQKQSSQCFRDIPFYIKQQKSRFGSEILFTLRKQENLSMRDRV